MCVGGQPRAPAPPAPRQAPRTPDATASGDQSLADLKRRNTLASMVFAGSKGALGAAPVAGKPVMGA